MRQAPIVCTGDLTQEIKPIEEARREEMILVNA